MKAEESKKIWNQNAEFWDNAMGDESNEFHREVVRPKVTELLEAQSTDYILDVACGNGNYSAYLAQKGISVVAFDYSEKMIELAFSVMALCFLSCYHCMIVRKLLESCCIAADQFAGKNDFVWSLFPRKHLKKRPNKLTCL